MSEESAITEAEATAEEAAPTVPLVAMLFTAASWTANMRFNRSGRLQSETIYAVGELAFRTQAGERRTFPARAIILAKDPELRLDLALGPGEAVITVPLEEFSLGRLRDQIKELVSGYGLVMRLGFSAADRPGRQILGAIDFAFSSVPRSAAKSAGRDAA